MSIFDKINYFKESASLKLNNYISNGKKSYEDEEILDKYGVPERVYINYDEDRDTTNIKLMEDGECYAQKTVDGDRSDYYLELYLDEGLEDEDIVTLSMKKGGLAGQPKPKKDPSGLILSGPDAFDIDADSRAAISRALVKMQKEANAPKLYLDGPVKLSRLYPEGKEAEMSFYEFVIEAAESNVSGFDILDNIKRIDKIAFDEDAIDKVVVSKDGMNLTFNSKDGKSASLNLSSGRRTIYDNKTDSLILADSNGPRIKQ